MYDYLLGGSHNFLADQDLGRSLAATDPSVRASARANRDFLGRAVRFLTEARIAQFLDIVRYARGNAAALVALLQGAPGAYRDTVLLNAAACLVISDRAATLQDGAIQAAAAIDQGAALALLETLQGAPRRSLAS